MSRARPIRTWLAVAVASSMLAQCSDVPSDVAPSTTNVLLIVADDVGIDMLGCYAASADHPPTPNLDELAGKGVRFSRAYANPLCSPTRATILTGRYGCRTHIGAIIRPTRDEFGLPLSETTLAEVLAATTAPHVATAAIGKWHLGSPSSGGDLAPNLQGFEWFQGTLGNFIKGDNYFAHKKVTNGVASASTTYATTEQVDDALARIASSSEPWFLYLGFNAAHSPFNAPPQALHTYTLNGSPRDSPREHCRAIVQALDTEIGRLLRSIPPQVLANTTIVFIGDNGSSSKVVSDTFDPNMAKDTLFEGGVHVPLIVAGKHVAGAGRVCDALVGAVDLFPTVLDLFGGSQRGLSVPKSTALDGLSFAPLLRDEHAQAPRSWVYAEHFYPNGLGPYVIRSRMVRDDRWKLIENARGEEQFFDVGRALQEGESLALDGLDAEQTAAYSHLRELLRSLPSS